MFAYGATGAGKTYTMSGREQVLGPGRGPGGRVRPGNSRIKAPSPNTAGRAAPVAGVSDGTEGLVPRSMRFLFQQVSALPPAVTMRIRASFYEIYNEVVYDLLTQGDRRPLQVGVVISAHATKPALPSRDRDATTPSAGNFLSYILASFPWYGTKRQRFRACLRHRRVRFLHC